MGNEGKWEEGKYAKSGEMREKKVGVLRVNRGNERKWEEGKYRKWEKLWEGK